jgi:hypothetical protein
MVPEDFQWETVLAWRTLCLLQGLLERHDATIRFHMDKGAIQASATINLDPNDSGTTEYADAEGTELAVTLMALASAADARLTQSINTTETERR